MTPEQPEHTDADEITTLRRERDEARAEVERRNSVVPGLSAGPAYALADVDLIDAHRGRPYERLRATVAQRDRLVAALERLLLASRDVWIAMVEHSGPPVLAGKTDVAVEFINAGDAARAAIAEARS